MRQQKGSRLTELLAVDDTSLADPLPDHTGAVLGAGDNETIVHHIHLRPTYTGHDIKVSVYHLHHVTYNHENDLDTGGIVTDIATLQDSDIYIYIYTYRERVDG